MNKLRENMRRFRTKNLRESIEMDIPSKQGTTRFTVSAQNGNLSIDSITSSDAKIKSGGYLVDDKVYSMSILPGRLASMADEKPIRILDIKQQGGTIQLNIDASELVGKQSPSFFVNIPSKIFESILVRAENNVDPILDRVQALTFFQDAFKQSSSVLDDLFRIFVKHLDYHVPIKLMSKLPIGRAIKELMDHITLKFTKVN